MFYFPFFFATSNHTERACFHQAFIQNVILYIFYFNTHQNLLYQSQKNEKNKKHKNNETFRQQQQKLDYSAFPVREFVAKQITKIIYSASLLFAVGRNPVQWMFLRT